MCSRLVFLKQNRNKVKSELKRTCSQFYCKKLSDNSSASQTKLQIPVHAQDYLKRTNTPVDLNEVRISKVLKLFLKLNAAKLTVLDGISKIILKYAAPIIYHHLIDLLNLSILIKCLSC